MIRPPTRDGPDRPLWAYGYELAPPVTRRRLAGVQAILDAGHVEALEEAQVWEGRFINGARITHILVVSGTPDRNRDINRRLEAELMRLEAGYSVSEPLEIPSGPKPEG